MACGLHIASPLGVNSEVAEHGANGFLAETNSQWIAAIEMLLSDSEIHWQMGAARRKMLRRGYSLQIYGPKDASILWDIARDGESRTQ